MPETGASSVRAEAAPRYPAIARLCSRLNWVFLACWAIYLAGPDVLGLLMKSRGGVAYALFAATFFLIHFALIATGIIALFVMIAEIYARRPVLGVRSVLLALALPILSFLYFAGRFIAEVQRWLER